MDFSVVLYPQSFLEIINLHGNRYMERRGHLLHLHSIIPSLIKLLLTRQKSIRVLLILAN